MKYVALLRGINVGGNTRVEMAKLKRTFESLGYQDVKTYINSGNVIFSTDQPAKKLDKEIEAAIKKDFELDVPVVVRDQANIEAIVKAIPKGWANDAEQKSDVMFLWEHVDSPKVVKQIKVKPELETLKYVHGVLLWNVSRAHVTRSGVLKVNATPLYKQMTIRNVNTVRKLATLMA